MFLDNIKKHKSIINSDDTVYKADEVMDIVDEWHKIGNENYTLVIKKDGQTDIVYHFALFRFNSSNMDGSNETWEKIFEGTGPSSSLREMRHIWWGDEKGYVYYLNMDAVMEAFHILKKYYD